MRGGEAIIKALKEEGTDVIFGYPGGQILPFYDMIYESDLKHILVRHEQSATHAADGYARASGKVGVCVTTSGPGATNMITGIATANIDSSPIIAISGQVATSLIGNDAFQEVDMIGITMPITKHNYQPNNPEIIPSIIKKSFEIASSGRPGPVVIDVPKNVQEGELKYYEKDLFQTPGYNPNLKGNIKQIRKAAELIKTSKKPVLLVGGGLIIADASKELKEFSNLINAPVTTTMMGKGAYPENDDKALGMIGMHGRKAANISIEECDCLIVIGCRFADRTSCSLDNFNHTKIIHIDIDPAEIGKNINIDIPIVGDGKQVLKSLISEIKKNKPEFSDDWLKQVIKMRTDYYPKLNYDDYPLKPQQVIKEISEVLDDDTIITTDVGQHQMWMAHYFNTNKPRKFISSGGLGTMGFGFPAAIGAKIALPESDVISVTGDGGFLMVCQDLATIKEYDLPIVICLFENRTLGMVYQWQELFYGKRYSHSKLGNYPDFIKLAESFGINGEYVEKVGETKHALKRAIKSGEPTLLNIAIDKSETLPMVPPGCRLSEIHGEYKTEKH
ncbi:MAG: acetolactate synthase large subunit [Methanobrevibacter sp.]|jgi:acetolactate synthase-1/2/3 large subunit|nr:acetolactate synthase large subunit [Candidatus Methanovirga meridionalis]